MVTLRGVAGLWDTGRAVFDRLLTSEHRDDDEIAFESGGKLNEDAPAVNSVLLVG